VVYEIARAAAHFGRLFLEGVREPCDLPNWSLALTA
jgi:hypothetical protein